MAGVKSQSTAAPPGDGAPRGSLCSEACGACALAIGCNPPRPSRRSVGGPFTDRIYPRVFRRPLGAPRRQSAPGAPPCTHLCVTLRVTRVTDPPLDYMPWIILPGSASRGSYPVSRLPRVYGAPGFQALCWAPAAWRGPDTLVGERDNERNHR